ncbi:MAG TPA: membrane protein insertase YidC [Vicinamibacteria bacterium]|nr:membrane protein insertase YidC [Vicinamibacteria bacterium]
MEERRLLLAVALSLVVLTAYSLLFAPATPPAPSPSPTATATAVTPSPVPAAVPGPVAAAEAAAEAHPAALAPTAAPVADERERRVEVAAPDYSVALTNKGARLLSWTLTRYKDARGWPEEMVPAQSGALRPLDLETGDPTVDAELREALFRPSTESLTVSGAAPQTLRFTFSHGDLSAEKTLSFPARGLVTLSVSVRRGGQALPVRVLWGPGVANASAKERDVRGYAEPNGVALVAGGGVQQFAAGKLPPGGQALTAVRWVGVESHYFAALFVPAGEAAPADLRALTLPARGEEKPVTAVVAAVQAAVPVQLFVGAKDHRELARLGHQLDRVVQVGDWIGPIVVALMGALRWVHEHVGNWGWSIVLLTLLINVAMAPFRHYSIVNGLKMAKVSPEMKVIQERYRKVPLMDPRRQQMQDEMGALYARHGMSMSSQFTVGCLPLLLTMPFLFAFYRVLSVLVDLRGAPFLWIPDLAQKDPLFLTPVLMGVSMFAMQKMTPSAMDPAQQRMMMLMPLMLAGMFLYAPAGLNLYWLTSNLWSILQQWVEMRFLRPAELKAPAGAKRRSR